MQKAHISLV